jgi:RNA polymerase sigma factor (TIGR02999 family)
VHEAYLRMVGSDGSRAFQNRAHFQAVAAEAMRRVLVDRARAKSREKRGGGMERVEMDLDQIATAEPNVDLLALNEALDDLEKMNPQKATLVKLRYFAGLTLVEAAETLGVSPSSADRLWRHARAWLVKRMRDGESAK